MPGPGRARAPRLASMSAAQNVSPDDDGRPHTEAIRAASVVVLRDGAAGLEVLMLRRPPGGNFGGFWVFPGGRVDDDDHAHDDAHDEADHHAPFRRCASREAREECALVIPPDRLVAMSYWEPPARSGVRFGTWFFAAPHLGGEVVIDGSEIVAWEWLRPADAHDRRDRGGMDLAPPTWVTLHTLTAFGSVDEAIRTLGRESVLPEYRTRMVRSGDAMVAMWPDDAGYETADPSAGGPRHRLTMGERYRFERRPME